MKYYIGIDPGLSGAVAVLLEDQTLVGVTDFQLAESDKLRWVDGKWFQSWLIAALAGSQTATACIEYVHAMPKQGVSSTFQFGVGFGSLLSVLQARWIPMQLVRAARWKKDQQLAGKDKAQALARARLQWPTAELHLKKHDGRAEALLIAQWSINKAKGMYG